MHHEKTRLIEFGRYAESNRKKKGLGKPETFEFLGFTHICGRTRNGRFIVRRQTAKKRVSRKLREIKAELRRRMHGRVSDVGGWLRLVLLGHYRYYGVPMNYDQMKAFQRAIIRLWYRSLKRRSQKNKLTWERMYRYVKAWLPNPRIMHPYPAQRLIIITQGRSPVR